MLQSNGRPGPQKSGTNKPLMKKPVVANTPPISTTTSEIVSFQAQDDALNALFAELGL